MKKRACVIRLAEYGVSCQNCSLAGVCLPKGLDPKELDELDRIIKRRAPMRRHEHLFGVGERFRFLYAVRSGAVKSWVTSANGDERIIGFHLPGELIGVDALDDGQHSCTAAALESTSICRVPIEALNALASAYPDIQAQVQRLLGEALTQANELLVLLGKRSAAERMASFLLILSGRLKRRGFSHREFSLTMTRSDIGNYLGLALGTVCRLLAELREDDVLSVHRRYIRIHDLDQLRAIVGVPSSSSAATS
ncbi:MAG: FNR family transcription factor [Gammaproteobacteria bacterium]|nr:MAG: FNR family transcription factor [Gammaproteobacteria bacterium]